MPELWLKFTDEKGERRRVAADQEKFVVGRHSSSDLRVASGKLSREHLKIERFGGVFVASDQNSKNGTTLNGKNLTEPVSLVNGDVLDLGGGLEIEIEIAAEEASGTDPAGGAVNEPEIAADSPKAPGVAAPPADNSISLKFLLLAPLLGLVVLLLFAGTYFVFSGGEKEIVSGGDEFNRSNKPRETPEKTENKSTGNKTPTPSSTAPGDNRNDNRAATPTPPENSDELEKIKRNAAEFMRRIAKNDREPFLTGEQAAMVGAKIKNLKNSAALAENLRLVKKNADEFAALADSKDLKPQFLAAAVLSKIDGSGDASAVARQMLPVLNELKIALDNNLANDNLLIIAAFDRGAAGKPRDLRNQIEALAKKTQNMSPREIRTIWFLRQNGKLSEAEFDFALKFLAVGTIMQNPKDFDINTEAVIF